MTGGKRNLKILIKSVNWIGDAMLLTPSLRALKQAFPESRVSLIVKPGVAQVFSANPHVDELIIEGQGEYAGLAGYLRMIRRLRKSSYDAGIVVQPKSFKAALTVFLSGAERRIGYSHNARNIFLTEKIKPHAGILHDADVFFGVFSPLGAVLTDREPVFNAGEESRFYAAEFLRAKGITESDKVAGINPGAKNGARRWPAENYARLADKLSAEYGYKIIVFGGPDDAATVRKVVALSRHAPVVVYPGLFQLFRLAGACRIFVSNDTGPAHVAAAAGVPVVVLYGATDPRRTAPLGRVGSIAVKAGVPCSPCFLEKCDAAEPMDCMRKIEVEEVLEAARSLL